MDTLNDQSHQVSVNAKNLRHFENKQRAGPSLQTVLRQRSRDRIKEKRSQLFNKMRTGLWDSKEEMQGKLMEIVQNEFNNLSTVEGEDSTSIKKIVNGPLEKDKTPNEILVEKEEWIIKEYEELLHCEEEYYTTYSVNEYEVCPFCKKFGLYEIPDFIICKYCGVKLKTKIALLELKNNIDKNLQTHLKICDKVPDFSLVCNNNDTSLCISCTACSSLSVIEMLSKTAQGR